MERNEKNRKQKKEERRKRRKIEMRMHTNLFWVIWVLKVNNQEGERNIEAVLSVEENQEDNRVICYNQETCKD